MRESTKFSPRSSSVRYAWSMRTSGSTNAVGSDRVDCGRASLHGGDAKHLLVTSKQLLTHDRLTTAGNQREPRGPAPRQERTARLSRDGAPRWP